MAARGGRLATFAIRSSYSSTSVRTGSTGDSRRKGLGNSRKGPPCTTTGFQAELSEKSALQFQQLALAGNTSAEQFGQYTERSNVRVTGDLRKELARRADAARRPCRLAG